MIADNPNLTYLKFDDKNFVLVGTAHVSKESARLVKSVIEQEKPDTVCVELCESRFQSIRQKDRWLDKDIIKVIKEKKSFLLLSKIGWVDQPSPTQRWRKAEPTCLWHGGL